MTGRLPLALALLLLAGCAAIRPRAGADATPPDAQPATAEPAAAGPEDDADDEDEADDAEMPAGDDDDAGAPAEPEAGAAEGAPEEEPSGLPDDVDTARTRARIVAAARRRLGTRPRLDCSGYVLDAYRAAGLGVTLGPGVSRSESLHASSRPVARPRPGDLAFFHDTYDRNHDGKGGDLFTHVALVEKVEGDVVTLLHRGGRIERIRMDVAHPSDATSNGILRVRRRRDAPGTRYLAGELFAAFGELLGGPFTRTLQGGPAAVTRARHPAPR